MGLLSLLFGSCSKPPTPPPLPPAQPSELQPLRLSIGPSPWAFVNRSTKAGGLAYRFRGTAPDDGKLAGLTSLQDAEGNTLLILDFQCYARILDDGTILLWRETGEKESKRIVFDSFPLSSLQRIADPLAAAAQLRESKLGVAPLPSSQHWEFMPRLDAGVHQLSPPHDWSGFEETLVLADHADSNGYDKMSRAIFAFDWRTRQVEVLPQDWFNNGNYDFGYQWVTRVARRSDGSIVGEGIRLGTFELDSTNRNIKMWTRENPFHMIQ